MPDLTASEMATRLGVTRAAVHYYIHLGRLQTYRTIQGDYRITAEEAERFARVWRTSERPMIRSWHERRQRAAAMA